jgi:hypothetical protein
LYGSETSSLILRKKHRWSVLDNNVVRRVFGLKRESDRRLEKTA